MTKRIVEKLFVVIAILGRAVILNHRVIQYDPIALVFISDDAGCRVLFDNHRCGIRGNIDSWCGMATRDMDQGVFPHGYIICAMDRNAVNMSIIYDVVFHQYVIQKAYSGISKREPLQSEILSEFTCALVISGKRYQRSS